MPTGLPPCPVCGCDETRMLFWGMPSPELAERAEREPIEFGGCVLPGERPLPSLMCPACNHEWHSPDEGARDIS
ncbi:MAG TPA: hypothetical protein GX743_12130 [Actinomycetales bacterium]|nr:hypothetical protein [Actinomycetales bacterium]